MRRAGGALKISADEFVWLTEQAVSFKEQTLSTDTGTVVVIGRGLTSLYDVTGRWPLIGGW